jgi:hypothetical protein
VGRLRIDFAVGTLAAASRLAVAVGLAISMVIVGGTDVDGTTIFLHSRKQVGIIAQAFRLFNSGRARQATDKHFCVSPSPPLNNERKGVEVKIRSCSRHSLRKVADTAKGTVKADYDVGVVDKDMDALICSTFFLPISIGIGIK